MSPFPFPLHAHLTVWIPPPSFVWIRGRALPPPLALHWRRLGTRRARRVGLRRPLRRRRRRKSDSFGQVVRVCLACLADVCVLVPRAGVRGTPRLALLGQSESGLAHSFARLQPLTLVSALALCRATSTTATATATRAMATRVKTTSTMGATKVERGDTEANLPTRRKSSGAPSFRRARGARTASSDAARHLARGFPFVSVFFSSSTDHICSCFPKICPRRFLTSPSSLVGLALM